MTIEAIEKKVQDLLGLEEAGFYEHRKWDRNYYLFKETDNLIYSISYEFFPKAGVGELRFNRLWYHIIFPKVNQILAQVWNSGEYADTFGALNADLYDLTILDIDNNYSLMQENYAKLPAFIEKDIYYEDRLLNACNVVKQCIEKFAFPFFAKFTTLQHVNDEIINVMPWNDLGRIIPRQTQFKKLVIMKLCNNPAYEEFVAFFDQQIKNQIHQGNTQYQSYYDAFTALLNHLESGKYLHAENTPFETKKTAPESETKKITLSALPQNKALETQLNMQRKILESIGIEFDSRFSLNDLRHNINFQSWGMETKGGSDLQYYLLLLAGTDVLDAKTGNYEPASPNVYYFDAEWDGFVDYGTILKRLNLLTGNALPFSNIIGHFDEFIGVNFHYKGKPYRWEYKYYDDWTDMRVFNQFRQLVIPDLINEYYLLPAGQGGLLFYFSPEQKQLFEQNFPDKQLIHLEEYCEGF